MCLHNSLSDIYLDQRLQDCTFFDFTSTCISTQKPRLLQRRILYQPSVLSFSWQLSIKYCQGPPHDTLLIGHLKPGKRAVKLSVMAGVGVKNGQMQPNRPSVHFSPSKLIQKKRDGKEMTKKEVEWFISEVSKMEGGCFTDSQIGAWLMATYLKDLSPKEIAWMTEAMMHSGDTLQWPAEFKGRLVDKHSTGGVGDKISLPLAPALAACGMKVPMISGRGLGHTGGTLDKLESIPNFRVTKFKQPEMNEILRDVGCFIIGQSGRLVPADKKLYSVRDVTATVSSAALITSSILSKKAAESLDALVLDVKCGKAAFMGDFESSKRLASNMVDAGSSLGIKMVAVITQMDNPIGRCTGNAIEVAESLQCLQGKGDPDVLELLYALGGHLLAASGHVRSEEAGIDKIKATLMDGSALDKFRQMMVAQGVNPSIAQKLVDLDMTDVDNIWSVLDKSENVTEVKTKSEGYVSGIDAVSLAVVAKELGAGREDEGADIDHSVGLRFLVAHGSHIKEGEVWVKVYHQSKLTPDHRARIEAALTLSSEPVDKKSRILQVIKGNPDVSADAGE